MESITAMHPEDACDGTALYQILTQRAARPDFDSHIMAAILALSFDNARKESKALAEAAGYETPATLAELFPHAAGWLEAEMKPPLMRSADEASLAELLWRGAGRHDAYQAELSRMMARRAQYPNHLWQDLGLNNRGELSRLMERHFPRLAARNTNDMKWKKFFYRTMCRDADFSLCTAPSCRECGDFDNCFGDESGLSLLAKNRLKVDLNQ